LGTSVSLIAVAAAAALQSGTPLGTPVGSPQPVPVAPELEALPTPESDPLRIDFSDDPVLALRHESASDEAFEALIRQAVARHPRVDEAVAGIAEAEAAKDEARSGLFPVVDLAFNSQRVFAREFDNDPDNIIERSRSPVRSDLTLSAQQLVWDFGATSNRIAAAGARLRAASFQAEASADRVALTAIAAWYDVFAFRALVGLGEAFTDSQQELRSAVQLRIHQGVSAPGDLPRVESYIASAEADLAGFRRQLANAEARFEEMFGVPPPPGLSRAPTMDVASMTKAAAEFLARSTADVETAEAIARATRREARAERASTFPSIAVGVDAGKYGLSSPDYDIRGRATLRYRLLGPGDARADQADARATAAEASATRVRSESEREAAIAWSDVKALEEQLAALEKSYIASRQSRDVLAERFRVARGTLFDLLESESGYFNVAATYIRAITELDAARYVLLSRTGRLLSTLDIDPPTLEGQ
jgi:adhesin transport system outer membrane protein